MPRDADAPIPAIEEVDTGDTISEAERRLTWAEKFKSYLCCRRPRFDEDGEHTWVSSKTLVLDVISFPKKKNDLK